MMTQHKPQQPVPTMSVEPSEHTRRLRQRQQQQRYINRLIKTIKYLLIALAISLVVLAIVIISNAYDNDEVKGATISNTPGICPSCLQNATSDPIEEPSDTYNPTTTVTPTIPTPTPTPSLEEKYAAVFDWQVWCGDFGVEQLYYLNEQCTKYDIPMEIMCALICTESSFRSDAKSPYSSASGYCQVIASTAEWIYEEKLTYGDYDIDNHVEIMTTNWKLNIEISCRLMYWLYYTYDENWDTAIGHYHGGTVDVRTAYLDRVNNNMNDIFGITTADIIAG